MSDGLRTLLLSVSSSVLTDIFIIIMTAIFLASLFCYRKRLLINFTDYTPGLLTSLGILGTFTGTIIGLFEFDIQQIEQSIAQLLEGLKTAFITSVIGIALSIFYRSITSIFPVYRPEEEIGIDTLHATMMEQTQAIKALSTSINKSQAENTRQYHQLTDDLATKSATALVNELSNVVNNFNEKVSQQFGEHFFEFGKKFEMFGEVIQSAAHFLQQHHEKVEQWTKSTEHNMQRLSELSEQMLHVKTQLSEIPSFMDSLSPMFESANQQITILNKQLQHYQHCAKAIESFIPDVENKMTSFFNGANSINQFINDDLKHTLTQYNQQLEKAQQSIESPIQRWTSSIEQIENYQKTLIEQWKRQLESSVGELNEHYSQSLISISAESKKLNEQVQVINKSLDTIAHIDSSLLDKIIQTSLSTYQDSLKTLTLEQKESYQQTSDALKLFIEQSLTQSNDSIRSQYAVIDQRMSYEIEKVLGSMGEALAAISGQFTRDYHQLITHMHRVMDSTRESQP